MKTVLEEVLAGGPVVTDGAWGTEMQARGLAPGDFPDGWNLRFPERVLQVARSYVEAGSQVILTNTFGANEIRLREAGLEKEATEINRAGVQISREAANGTALVFASVGPSGKMLLNGDVSLAELLHAFAEQAGALADAGADALVIETMCDLQEAEAALAAAKETGLPVVACMVFDSGKQKDRTMMGATPEDAARRLEAAGADVIGLNCGLGIESSVEVCRRLRAATSLPVWIKPNAGLPELANGTIQYRTGPEQFARYIPDLIRAGANFVGGCCGTSPEFIRAVRAAIESG